MVTCRTAKRIVYRSEKRIVYRSEQSCFDLAQIYNCLGLEITACKAGWQPALLRCLHRQQLSACLSVRSILSHPCRNPFQG